eukprot:TRINITY_DN55632_c0_g1_i1.p1 TRINITY_DN55632_c0_g1~~TRINITY_DN55632_c0_g1_i1.p1  ORF type:complete len:924 (+),score=241.41 TRINITY_DN55632_c0_g1_i1:142-2913(+)
MHSTTSALYRRPAHAIPVYRRHRPHSQREALCVLCISGSLLAACVWAMHSPSFEAASHSAAGGVLAAIATAAGAPRPGARPGLASKRPLNDPFWTRFHNVSVIYTWVNGSDPDWNVLRQQHGGKGSASRYRDTEELLHSLRSFYEHWPWHTGTIYMLTPGHFPWWLNRSHPRIQLVDQNDIIPEDSRPAFNSAVVEQNMWRIPGLTDLFIHINDDYLFGRNVHPSDLFTDDGGVRLYLEGGTVRGARREYLDLRASRRKQWLGSVYHTNGVLEDIVGKRRRYFVKHAPFIYYKRIFEVIHERWPEVMRKAGKCRFRSYDDVLVPFLHHGVLDVVSEDLKLPFASHNSGSDLDAVLCIIKDDTRDAHRKMAQHIIRPHMFFTVNDGFQKIQSAELLKSFLHAALPRPSPFELRGAVPEHRGDIAAWSDQHSVMMSRCSDAARGSLHHADSAAAPPRQESRDPEDCGKDEKCSGHGECTNAGCRCAEGWTGTTCWWRSLPGQKTHLAAPACESVDAVFTWVNGSDPGVAAALRKEKERGATVEQTRDNLVRDLGQLRFALRSVMRHMPWIRHFWVLSGTPRPSWLRETERLTFVPHSAIFAPEELPRLGSNAIQSRIHRIPGLAMRYISMDDDYLILRPSPPSTVLGSGRRSVREWWRGPWKPELHKAGIQRDAMQRARDVVAGYFKPHGNEVPYYTPAHVPQVVDRLAAVEMQAAFGPSMQYSVLRQSSDVEPNFAYAWFIQGHSAEGAPEPPHGAAQAALEAARLPEPAGERPGGSDALGPLTANEALCRAEGLWPEQWRPEVREMWAQRLGGKAGCGALVDQRVAADAEGQPLNCTAPLARELARAAFRWTQAPAAEAFFGMLKAGLDMVAVERRLRSDPLRVACLNDDFVDEVPQQDLSDLNTMLLALYPDAAQWERPIVI